MGNFEIGDYIVGVTIFILVTMSIMALVGGIVEQKPDIIINSTYTDFNTSFNKYLDLNQSISVRKDEIDLSTPGEDSGLLGSINSLMKTASSGVKYFLISFSVMDDAYRGLNTQLGIPTFVGDVIKLLVTVLIIFAFFKLIFRSPTV